jgi:PKD repeat protein
MTSIQQFKICITDFKQRYYRLFLILFASLLLLAGCTKKPVSCFNIDTENPKAGIEVQFSNCSEDAEYYHWEFGDGNSSNQEKPTHIYTNTGQYIVSLIALSKNEEKESLVTKVIDVAENIETPGNGQVVFWREGNSPIDFPNVLISISGSNGYMNAGQFTGISSSEPDCGTAEGITFTLSNDQMYSFNVVNIDNGQAWVGYVFEIHKDQCLAIKID